MGPCSYIPHPSMFIGCDDPLSSRLSSEIYRDLVKCNVGRSTSFAFPRDIWTNVFQRGSDVGVETSPSEVFYKRPVMQDIERQLSDSGDYVLLRGPPGSGKTICAFLHALNLTKGTTNRRILWIDTRYRYNFLIERGYVVGLDTGTGIPFLTDLDDISDVFVILGNRASDPRVLSDLVVPWSRQPMRHRKVTLILGDDKCLCDADTIPWRTVTVPPWTFKEYEEALRIDEIRNSFAEIHGLSDNVSFEQLLSHAQQHFYYAGGSARLFFLRSTFDTMDAVRGHEIALPGTKGPWGTAYGPNNVISAYHVVCLGLRFCPAEFVEFVSNFDGQYADSYFEGYVISSIRQSHQVPREWVKRGLGTFCTDKWTLGDEFRSNFWYMPLRNNLAGITCFTAIEMSRSVQFVFVMATRETHFQIDTSDIITLITGKFGGKNCQESVQVKFVFAIPQGNALNFHPTITGDWSRLGHVNPKWRQTFHSVRIWTLS